MKRECALCKVAYLHRSVGTYGKEGLALCNNCLYALKIGLDLA